MIFILIFTIILEIFFSYFFELDGTDYTRKHILKTLLKDYKKYKNESFVYKEEIKNIKQFDLKDEVEENNNESVVYVLIIGESSSRNHYSIYNYFRNTTPCLMKLKEEGELDIFNDVISPYPMTREALVKILTSMSEDKIAEAPSIIDIFKAAGYKTYWLSNQESYGISGNLVAGMAKNADVTMYTEIYSASSRKLKKYDENLFPLFREILLENIEKKFIVIHLMGNHLVYKERYPEKFEKFTKKDINFNKTQEKHYKIINNYDNSILYVDFCINEFIKKIREQNKKSYMLYISDHGDEVYDEKERLGHAPGLAGKYTAEIPFVLWTSNKYRKDVNKIEKIKKSINKKYTTENLIHTLLELSYIKWKKFDSSKSIINDDFKTTLRTHGSKNYDKEIKNSNKLD